MDNKCIKGWKNLQEKQIERKSGKQIFTLCKKTWFHFFC